MKITFCDNSSNWKRYEINKKKKKEGTSKANGQKGIISMPVNSISN